MSGLRDIASIPGSGALSDRAGSRFGKRQVLPSRGASWPSGLSTIGMVLGYLGLVAILATAPFWQQAGEPHRDQPAVCTDFGGSR